MLNPSKCAGFKFMKYIKLTQGKRSIIDDEDFKRVSQYKWHFHSTGYAFTHARNTKDKKLRLHRFILNPPKTILIDHINRDKLDNRKENLRFATKQQNGMNSGKKRKFTSSIYKGVQLDKRAVQKNYPSIWVARLANKHLGHYQTEKDAAKAYDLKAKELFGEFAYLNFNN